MPVVQNTATDPAGNPLYPANVTITLIAAPGGHATGYTGAGTIVGTYTTATDPTGHWSATLPGNATITPANTYYLVNEGGWTTPIVVPTSGGPYNTSAILATPPPTPAAPGITGVQVAANGIIAGSRPELNLVAGTNVTVAAADNPGANRVDVTIAAAGGGGGGSGNVTYRGDWAAATAYAVNDLVRLKGSQGIVTAPHTSGATFDRTKFTPLGMPVGEYNVLWYGAHADGATDDTAAIAACFADAVASEVASGRNQAVVYMPPLLYQSSGSLTQGGATHGNAAIPLPVIPEGNQAFELTIRSSGNAAPTRYFNQPPLIQLQGSGAVIRCTIAGTNDATFGEASVIGGPTPAQGYGRGVAKFSNMGVTIDGVSLILNNDPHISGFDLAGVARCNIINAGVYVNAIGPAGITPPSQGWQFAFRLPDNDNNDQCDVGRITSYGSFYGVIINEHTVAKSIKCLFNVVAVEVSRTGDTAHGSIIDYISAEACNVGLGAANSTFPCKVTVGLLDWEFGSWNGGDFAVINDPNSALLGSAHVTIVNQNHLAYNPSGGNFAVRGAAFFRIFDDTWRPGDVATSYPGIGQLTIPASGAATVNPFYNNVTAVFTAATGGLTYACDGVSQTVAAAAQLVVQIRTGATFTLTYANAPTWKVSIQ